MNTNGNKNTLKANKILIPVILLIGLIPIIVHSFVYDTNLAQFDWYPESAAKQTDFFFAWKMIAIILVGVVMLAILLIQYLNKKEFKFENSFSDGVCIVCCNVCSVFQSQILGGTWYI